MNSLLLTQHFNFKISLIHRKKYYEKELFIHRHKRADHRFSINNLTLDIDNRGHYIGNGILCGIGISIFVTQMLRLIRNK